MDWEPILNVFGRPNLENIDPETALDNAKITFECFRIHIDHSKLDEHLEQVWDEENGIKNFLMKKLAVKPFKESKDHLLQLIKFILANGKNDKKWKKDVFPFVKQFMNITKLYWKNSNEPAKNQITSLDCLIEILEVYGDQIHELELELSPLYWELLPASEKSVYQPSVRGKMFHLLGLIAAVTRDSLFTKEGQLLQLYRHIVLTLRNQVECNDKQIEQSIIQGCLKAMDKLLQYCSSRLIKQGKDWDQFCNNLAQLVDPWCSIAREDKKGLKRREFQRVGLEVIANNAILLNKELFQNYKQWYKDLETWAKSNNANDSSAGKRAIFSFLKAIFDFAKCQTEDPIRLDEFTTYFVQTFGDILSSEAPRRNELIVAITGVGILSPLCSNTSKVTLISEKVLESVRNVAFELNNPITNKYSGSISMLTTYLDCVSNLLQYAIEESEDEAEEMKFLSHLNSIEQLTVQFLIFYPELSEHQRKSGHHCFLKIVNSLHLKHNQHCIPFVDRVLRSVMSQIIASPTSAELSIIFDAWKSQKDQSGTGKRSNRHLGLKGVSSYLGIWINISNSNQDNYPVQLVFDRIMDWSLSIMEKLDLSMVPLSDIENDKEETFQGDVFSNMKACTLKDFQLLVNLVEFLQKFLTKAESSLFQSWISEFITKVISLAVANPLVSGFYKILGTAFEVSRKLEFFNDAALKVPDIFDKCNLFMKSVYSQMDVFRDDLLVSVLELWLSAPDEILIHNFHDWSSTLQKIFRMGRVCLYLADKCLDAFQRWTTLDSIPSKVMEDIFPKLFPIWQCYFASDGYRDTTSVKSLQTLRQELKSKPDKALFSSEDEENEKAELRRVQIKMLNAIGSYAHVIDLEAQLSTDLSLTQDHNVIKFRIPLIDSTPDIYLDSLIPKVLSLCENSVNRQIRTCACEFLHTVILYFLGFSVRSTISSQQPVALFSSMFEVVMKLSGDMDLLVRQLFNPLASQCIHWFTKQKNGYSDAILQVIMDGVISENAQLKDVSGDCLSEYFKWALKYDNNKLARDVINFILALSTHAAPKYRIGASTGFNSIYRDFRENMELNNSFTISLLISFLTSLDLSHNFKKDSIVVKSNKIAISHLERILLGKKDNFNNNIGKRKRPQGFTGKFICLRDLAEWLYKSIGHPNTIFREECSRLLTIIAPVVRGCGETTLFLKTVANEATSVISNAERVFVGEDFKIDEILSFMEASSACYAFLLNHKSSMIEECFQNQRSKFIKLLNTFTSFFQTDLLTEEMQEKIIRIVGHLKTLKTCFPPLEEHQFNQFLLKISKNLEQDNQISLIMQYLLESSLSEELKVQLTQDYIDIFNCLRDSSDSTPTSVSKLKWMRSALESKLFSVSSNISESEIQKFIDICWSCLNQRLFNSIGDNADTNAMTMNTNIAKAKTINLRIDESKELLRMCLSLGINENTILDAAFDLQPLHNSQLANDSKITKGEHFQKSLIEVMVQAPIFTNFSKMLQTIKVNKVGSYIESLMLIIKSNKHLKTTCGARLFENVIKIWTPISINCDSFTVARILSGLALLDLEQCQNSPELCNWWCGKDSIGDINFDFRKKSEFISFFVLFALSSRPEIVNDATCAVENMILSNFPTTIAGKSHLDGITNITIQILNVLEKSPANLKLVNLILLCIVKLSILQQDTSTFRSLFKHVAKRLRKLVQTLNQAWISEAATLITMTILISDNQPYTDNLVSFQYCLVPVILGMPSTVAMKMFFKAQMNTLMDVLVNSPRATPISLSQLNKDIIVYNLLSIVARRCGSQFLSELTKGYQLYQGNKGVAENARKSILKVVSSAFVQIKQRQLLSADDAKQHQTMLQCNSAAYNALVAILVRTENIPHQQKLMEGLLIHEDVSKNQHLWENLVDCSKNIQNHFPVLLEMDDISATQIEDTSQDDGEKPSNSYLDVNQKLRTRITLAGSSLVQDIYDMSPATASNAPTELASRNESTFYKGVFEPKKSLPNANKKTVLEFTCAAFSLECTEGLVLAIKKLASFTSENENLQPWMKYLRDTIQGSRHENIKIFILTAFLNCEKELKPHALHFIEGICNFIINMKWTEPAEPFNYFTKDILIMLLSWSDTASPQANTLNQLSSYVIANIVTQSQKHSRKDLFEHNLKLLETMILRWKMKTEHISADQIIQHFKVESPIAALRIYKNILMNDIVPLDNPKKFLDPICQQFHKSKAIYSEAAQVSGLFMRKLKMHSPDIDVTEYVKKRINSEKSRPLVFLDILQNIQLEWPQIALTFKDDLLQSLGHEPHKAEIVSILFTHFSFEIKDKAEPDKKKSVLDFVSDLNGRNFFNSPCSTSDSELGVCILETLSDNFNFQQESCRLFMKIVNWLKNVQEDLDRPALQARFYNCVGKIYNQFTQSEPLTQKILLDLMNTGSIIENSDVSKVVDEFWVSNLHNASALDYLLKLTELLSDNCRALEIILGRILQRCKTAPEFSKDIFDQPLEDCVFYNYNLDTSWRARQTSFLPMFAESLSSQDLSTIPEAVQSSIMRQRQSVPHFGVNLLRASLSVQQRQFSLTQPVADDDDDSSEFFPIQDLVSTQDLEATQDPDENLMEQECADSLLHLKRRFYKRPMAPEYFSNIQRNIRSSKVEATMEKLNSKRNMKLNRTYRVGEIPDIMIKNADVLTTLIKLGQEDTDIGRTFFVQICSALLKENPDLSKTSVYKDFETVLEKHSEKSPLCASIIDISIRSNILLSPQLVSEACVTNNLYELGIIMLEKHLKDEKLEEPLMKKRRIDSEQNLKELTFLHIANLYQGLEEFDVLQNIFEKISQSPPFLDTAIALSLESSKNLEGAVEKYKSLFDENTTKQGPHSTFIETSYLKCLAQLSNWNSLMDAVETANKSSCCDISSNSRRNWFMAQAGIMLKFHEKDHSAFINTNAFIQKLEESGNYCAERATLLLCFDSQNAYKSAALLDKFWISGVAAFSNLQNLSPTQKKEQILQYQLASSLNDILSWQKYLEGSNAILKTEELLQKFEKLSGSSISPLLNSSVMVASRTFFLKKFLSPELLDENLEIANKLNKVNFSQNLWMLSLGLRDQNFVVSSQFLEKSKLLGDNVTQEDFISWRKLYVDYTCLYQHLLPEDEWRKMWARAWKKVKFGSSLSQETETEPEAFINMQGKLLHCLVTFTQQDQQSISKSFKDINHAMQIQPSSSIQEAIEIGSKKLLKYVSQPDNKSNLDCNAFTEVYQLIEKLMECFPEKYSDCFDMLQLMLDSLIRSMADSETSKGVLLFPRLLDLIQNGRLHETFQNMWKIVPAWKFLPWLDQILTCYNCDPSLRTILEPVVNNLVQIYPDAFHLQYRELLSGNSDFHSKYLMSLKALVLPTVLHKEIIENLKMAIIKKDLENVKRDLMNFRTILQEISNNKDIFGLLHILFADEMRDQLTSHIELFENDDDPMNGTTAAFDDAFSSLKNGMEAIILSHDKKIFGDGNRSVKILKLKEFSPWLAKFQHSDTAETIKLPGLFNKLSKPDVEEHPNVISFDTTVTIYRSLTFPIRFTIQGNDGKKYSFLAKFGDDLRQDRRIQQLFLVANNFFSESSETRNRRIHITSYSVIPISETFGLIEWLEKTVKISSFILNTRDLEEKHKTAQIAHEDWLLRQSRLGRRDPQWKMYCAANRNTSRQVAEKHFEMLTSTTPESLLADHLLERSRSFEQFFRIRQSCIRSYAAMCLVHWLIGIGDRHLQNSLLSLETGRIIGIDFGRAFEATNNAQSIPEMIPFRLSPNFNHLLMPYGYRGLFKETMCIAWRCLLLSSESIIFIINTFVNEQSMNWTKSRKITGMITDDPLENPSNWQPLQIIKNKLKCKNPKSILLNVIKSNPQKEIVPIYCDIIRDCQGIGVDEDKTLTNNEIIDCILELATDKNILARIYVGLSAWI